MKTENTKPKAGQCPICEFESGWGYALCHWCGKVFAESAFNGNGEVSRMRSSAILKRQDAIESGDECRERYYRGAVDALTFACNAIRWRNPRIDPPTQTGKILVWVNDSGPAVVNVEERWMAYFNGLEETGPTDVGDWDWWCEIERPKSYG